METLTLNIKYYSSQAPPKAIYLLRPQLSITFNSLPTRDCKMWLPPSSLLFFFLLWPHWAETTGYHKIVRFYSPFIPYQMNYQVLPSHYFPAFHLKENSSSVWMVLSPRTSIICSVNRSDERRVVHTHSSPLTAQLQNHIQGEEVLLFLQ